jgi:hypothetical protein
MRTNLTWFLILCKGLSSEPFPFRPPQSKSRALVRAALVTRRSVRLILPP